MAKQKMVRFNQIAGAQMRWRYFSKHPYGWGRTGSRPLRKNFLDKLTAACMDMGFLCKLGVPRAIVSAGAWVPESDKRGPTDKHVLGRAIDIDALHWTQHIGTMSSPRILLASGYENHPTFYLGVEANFRRHFGTVLGYLYNKQHRGHWHIDDGSRVCYRESSRSRVLFLQASLAWVWRFRLDPSAKRKDLGIDGVVGPRTRSAIKLIREHLNLTKPLTDITSWRRYLLSTAIVGMQGVDSLAKSL